MTTRYFIRRLFSGYDVARRHSSRYDVVCVHDDDVRASRVCIDDFPTFGAAWLALQASWETRWIPVFTGTERDIRAHIAANIASESWVEVTDR